MPKKVKVETPERYISRLNKPWSLIHPAITEMAKCLIAFPGVKLWTLCDVAQDGSEGGYVLASWPEDIDVRLKAEYDIVTIGQRWGYVRPRLLKGAGSSDGLER